MVLQAANVRLQDELYSSREHLMHQQPNYAVDAAALKRRLDDITAALLTYRVTHSYV